MTAPLLGLALFGVLVVGLPVLTADRDGVPPRVAAAAHLLSLLGWAVLPTVWLACSSSAAASQIFGGPGARERCLSGLSQVGLGLLRYLPAGAILGLLGWHVLRQAVLARRAELRRSGLERSVRRSTSRGEVWVVPSAGPLACAEGLWHCRAVVSSGLLARLETAEREAVCEHEAAHVRLGHPRLLLFGTAVAATARTLTWEGRAGLGPGSSRVRLRVRRQRRAWRSPEP